MDAEINDQVNLVKEHKAKVINKYSPDEIQKKADLEIQGITKQINRKKTPPELVSILVKCLNVLEKDPVSGLALVDAIEEILTEEIGRVKNENANF